MFEAAVEGLGGTVRGAGPVEVGQHIVGSLLQCSAQCDHLGQRGGDAVADRGDQAGHHGPASGPVGFTVGRDHPLVDAPGGFDLDMIIAREQGSEPVLLPVGEEAGAGVQGPARRVERVTGAASMSVDGLLDASAASVEGVAGEADHVEGIHDGGRVGQFFGGGALEPGEPVHRDDLNSVAPCLVAFGQPLLERLLGAPFDHVEKPGRPCPVADAGQVDDHGDVLVAAACVAPHVLIHADGLHTVEPGRVVDQDPLAFSQDRGVGGVPRHPEPLGDPGDGEMLNYQALQRPPQSAA